MSEAEVNENTNHDQPSETAAFALNTSEAGLDESTPPSGDTTSSSLAFVAESTSGTPAIKKKRTSDYQITKDDYDRSRDDDEPVGEIKHGFQRASAEVLAKRKIFRVKRPSASATSNTGSLLPSSNPFAATNLNGSAKPEVQPSNGESSKSANPFATTTLVTYSKDQGVEKKDSGPTKQPSSEAPKMKVFGSGSAFAGFNTTVSGNGFGSASGGFGSFGSNNSVGGFGSDNGSKSLGFSTVSASTDSASGIGPTATSSILLRGSGCNASGSLFPPSTGFSFSGFKSASDQNDHDEDAGAEEEVEIDVASGGNMPAVVLPEHVELTTGEEDEEVIHEGRCKSFQWVRKPIKTEDPDTDSSGVGAVTKGNPYIKQSAEFEAAMASVQSKDETGDLKPTDDTDTKESQTYRDKEKAKEKGSSGGTEKSVASQEFQWRELGVGPMKILKASSKDGRYRLVQRRESTKNGPATKVILNVPLWKESLVKRAASKYLTLKTPFDAKLESFSFHFKESSDASFFFQSLMESIGKAKAAFD